MIAFLGQVLAVMPTPVLIVVSACLGILRALPWAMLAGAAGSGGVLLVTHLNVQALPAWERGGLDLPFWRELPAWVVAGAVWAALFFLVFRGLAWAIDRVPRQPPPPY